jgi:hypothetical protein
MKTHLTLVASLAVLVAACGGPPKNADDATTSAASTTTPADHAADMPPTPGDAPGAGKAADPAAAATKSDATPATTAPAFKIVALKLVAPAKHAKKLGFTTIEVKDDGSITVDGKAAGKFANDQLQDGSGTALLSVSQDGTLSGDAAKGAKFGANDELALDGGAKLSVADDGSVLMVDGKGKSDVMPAKFESANAWAKREAALVVMAFVVTKQGAAAGPTSAKADGAKPKKK